MYLQEIENKIAEMRVKAEFTSKQGARVTTIYEQSYVLKKFMPNKKHKNEWVTEYAVISRLSSENILVPNCYGYLVDDSGAYLYKEFVPGKVLTSYNQQTAQQLALMFANFHDIGVVTCDAHNENVIQTLDGELLFIDFGKATIFEKKSLLFYFTVAREIFFIKTKIIKNRAIFNVFLEYYLSLQADKSRAILLIFLNACNHALQLRENLRQKHKKRK